MKQIIKYADFSRARSPRTALTNITYTKEVDIGGYYTVQIFVPNFLLDQRRLVILIFVSR